MQLIRGRVAGGKGGMMDGGGGEGRVRGVPLWNIRKYIT